MNQDNYYFPKLITNSTYLTVILTNTTLLFYFMGEN